MAFLSIESADNEKFYTSGFNFVSFPPYGTYLWRENDFERAGVETQSSNLSLHKAMILRAV